MAIISSVNLSQAVAADRLDAEFFDPEDLSLIARLKNEGGQVLSIICEVLNGKTPAYEPDGEVSIVRSGDLVAPLIYPSCSVDFLRAPRTSNMVFLQTGDVLISSIGMGSIGKISLVMDAGNFATVSEVTILRTRSYSAEVLFAYLTTNAGQRQIARQITGATGQQHLLKSKVATIYVPQEPSKKVRDAIKESCKRAWELELDVMRQHAKTHALFADTLGL